jgi:hypothetical protein
MSGQVRRLIELAARPNVTIEVVPFSAGAHPGLKGPFIVFEFADAVDEDVVFVESTQGDFISRGFVEDVASYREQFERLRTVSLSTEDSMALLNKVMAGF